MKKLLTVFLIFFLEQGCSLVKPYKYEICVREPGQVSQLLQNKLIGIADTSVVNVSGQILNKNTLETISHAYAVIENKISSQRTNQMVDSIGNFNFIIPPGEYRLLINCIGYSDFDSSMIFKSGEIRNLKFAMGESGGFTMYEIKSPTRLSDLELERRASELSNKRNQ